MEETKHEDVQSMFELILAKLDVIDDHVKSVKQELKELQASLEFAHGESKDLKEENKALKKWKDTNKIKNVGRTEFYLNKSYH